MHDELTISDIARNEIYRDMKGDLLAMGYSMELSGISIRIYDKVSRTVARIWLYSYQTEVIIKIPGKKIFRMSYASPDFFEKIKEYVIGSLRA